MYCRLRFFTKCFVSEIPACIFMYIILGSAILALLMLGGCRAAPVMSFEEDRPVYTNSEPDFFQESSPIRPSPELHPNRILHADDTEEAAYLENIIRSLEQSKILAAHAQRQARSRQRKVFNYGALEIDIDTVILAIKRYLAADDYTPRGFESLPPTRLNARYSDVE